MDDTFGIVSVPSINKKRTMNNKFQNAVRTAAVIVSTGLIATIARHPASAAIRSEQAPLATPLGVTLQEIIAVARGEDGDSPAAAPEDKSDTKPEKIGPAEPKPLPFLAGGGPLRGGGAGIAYADASGKTLYTFDKDVEPGKSTCVDACAEAWPPARVPEGTRAFGDWSIVTRSDRTKQWAYRGKPLYTFAKDTGAGQKNGDGADKGAWHMARFNPAQGIRLPFGVRVAVSDVAGGYVLVDSRGVAMYTFNGNPAKGSAGRKTGACATPTCLDFWAPVAAAQIANPTGDFTLVGNDAGVMQWAYKGKPLYTFGRDYLPGDANGMGVDNDFEVAYLARFYTPAQATVRFDHSRGPIMTTAEGMTLYRRDTSYHQPDGHGLPGSVPGSPVVGHAMGTKSCEKECLKTWRPLVPPAKALPSGYWEIFTRADGSRQWAYKGFAMYTYSGDKQPGDKTGNEIYDLRVSENPADRVYETDVVPNATAATLFWAYAEP